MMVDGKLSGDFFSHRASLLTLLQGPRTVTTQTASSPIILQTHTDPPCTPAHTSNLLVNSAGWKGLRRVCAPAPGISVLGERRGDRREAQGKKQRFRNTLQHNGLGQGSTG